MVMVNSESAKCVKGRDQKRMENIYEFGDFTLDPPHSDGTFGDISLKENCSGHK